MFKHTLDSRSMCIIYDYIILQSWLLPIWAFQSCAKERLLRPNTAQGSTQLSPHFMALGHLLVIKLNRHDNSANRIKGVSNVFFLCFDYLCW